METYVEYDICVNKKTYHVTVSEEHNDKETIIALTFTDGKEIHISIGKARCNPTDEFDLAVGVKTAVKDCTMLGFYGYRVGLDDAIWHGFRRAQWHKMHDVTDEQMMITHWMPLSGHSHSITLSPETIAGFQKMINGLENALKILGDTGLKKPVGFIAVDTPSGLTVSDGKISLDEMTFHRIDTGDDGWISVEERLPEEDPKYPHTSIVVEAKFEDGHTEEDCWCGISSKTWERSAKVADRIENRRDVIAWRPLRGDK